MGKNVTAFLKNLNTWDSIFESWLKMFPLFGNFVAETIYRNL